MNNSDTTHDSKSRRGRPPNIKQNVVEQERKERIPLGTRVSKLTVPQRHGYQRRWMNDSPGRIEDAKRGGYSLVVDPTLKVGNASEDGNSEIGGAVSRVVGTQEGGNPMKAYLMEIPQSWYDEDQSRKREARMEIEAAIIRGDDQQKIKDERGLETRGYVPLSGNKITKGY